MDLKLKFQTWKKTSSENLPQYQYKKTWHLELQFIVFFLSNYKTKLLNQVLMVESLSNNFKNIIYLSNHMITLSWYFTIISFLTTPIPKYKKSRYKVRSEEHLYLVRLTSFLELFDHILISRFLIRLDVKELFDLCGK